MLLFTGKPKRKVDGNVPVVQIKQGDVDFILKVMKRFDEREKSYSFLPFQ